MCEFNYVTALIGERQNKAMFGYIFKKNLCVSNPRFDGFALHADEHS